MMGTVRVVDVDEARRTLSQLLEQVELGARVVITVDGRPVADLVPHQRPE